MAEKNLPEIVKDTDISDKDMEKVHKFINDGLPEISCVDDHKLRKMLELYMDGSSYWQISNITGVKRHIILYLSYKFKWYPAKREYMYEHEEQMKGRVIDAKLRSLDYLLLLNQAYQKRISKGLQRYLATDDPSHMDNIDLKEIAQLHKTIEMINELTGDKEGRSKSPAVGLNLGDGVTIERSGDNQVTITPKQKAVGDLLKQYADSRREEEKLKTYDTNKEHTKKE